MPLVGWRGFYFSKFRWPGFQVSYPLLAFNIRPRGLVSHVLLGRAFFT